MGRKWFFWGKRGGEGQGGGRGLEGAFSWGMSVLLGLGLGLLILSDFCMSEQGTEDGCGRAFLC